MPPELSGARWPPFEERRQELSSRLAGLDVLACGVVLLDGKGQVRFANMAAEQLFDVSLKLREGGVFARHFINGAVIAADDGFGV